MRGMEKDFMHKKWNLKSNHLITKTTHCMTIILIICSSFQETEKEEQKIWKTKTHLKAAFLGKTHEIHVYIVHFSSSHHIDVCIGRCERRWVFCHMFRVCWIEHSVRVYSSQPNFESNLYTRTIRCKSTFFLLRLSHCWSLERLSKGKRHLFLLVCIMCFLCYFIDHFILSS